MFETPDNRTGSGQSSGDEISQLIAEPSLRSRLRPERWLPSLKAARVLWKEYAHFRTVATQAAIDSEGQPLPWYTYPAIEYLSALDFSEKSIFEFGAGMSTLFWAARAKSVVSVEDDERWFEKVARISPANVTLSIEPDLSVFPDVVRRAGTFDVIVVDGPARGYTRLKCCRAALNQLRKGGLIILDNSDWLPESSELLRTSGLLEVDFTGFVPICAHVQTTSLFFDRSFNAVPRNGRQPVPGRGAAAKLWEGSVLPGSGKLVTCDGESFSGVADDVTFVKHSPGGPRRFRAFSYGRDNHHIAIFDLDRDRVLLSLHHPAGRKHDNLTREIERISAMPWDVFTSFIADHECRRYLLNNSAVV
jgi:hypothetical protein